VRRTHEPRRAAERGRGTEDPLAYAGTLTSAAASGELRRCAGTQFDATVVEALCAVLDAGDAPPVSPRESAAPRPA
jgi:hypothetical protein